MFSMGMGHWKSGLVTAALVLCATAAAAQVPNPKPAIDAAKNARAATEAAQKKNSEALAPSASAGQAPQKPAEKPEPAQQQPTGSTLPPGSAPGTSASGYSYDPAGRRDPFVSLIGRGGETAAPGARPQGVPGLLISEVTVKGVLKTAKGDYVALLQAPDNKTYIAHGGDKVLDGAIKAITAAEVVFTQDVTDPLSLVKQREVRKAIRPEAR
jgi:hypothetical protein